MAQGGMWWNFFRFWRKPTYEDVVNISVPAVRDQITNEENQNNSLYENRHSLFRNRRPFPRHGK